MYAKVDIGRKDDHGLPPAIAVCKVAEGREYFYLTLRFRRYCYTRCMLEVDFYRSTWGILKVKVRAGTWDLLK